MGSSERKRSTGSGITESSRDPGDHIDGAAGRDVSLNSARTVVSFHIRRAAEAWASLDEVGKRRSHAASSLFPSPARAFARLCTSCATCRSDNTG